MYLKMSKSKNTFYIFKINGVKLGNPYVKT